MQEALLEPIPKEAQQIANKIEEMENDMFLGNSAWGTMSRKGRHDMEQKLADAKKAEATAKAEHKAAEQELAKEWEQVSPPSEPPTGQHRRRKPLGLLQKLVSLLCCTSLCTRSDPNVLIQTSLEMYQVDVAEVYSEP